MRGPAMANRTLLALAAALLLAAPAAAQVETPAPSAEAWAALPDWSGDWVLAPGKADAPAPYKPDWAAKAARAAAGLKSGKSHDPFATCGLPAGAPRMMSLPGVHEWIVRPGEVRHAVEDGNSVQRIYTGGYQHPVGDDLFATYTGDNVGRWEGETLVIDTVGLKPDTWLDGAGGVHSDQIHVVTRLRKTGPDRMEADIRIDDPVAFTGPWRLVRHYRRLPAGSFVHDYACGIVGTAARAAALK
jgi:hypothetical protein